MTEFILVTLQIIGAISVGAWLTLLIWWIRFLLRLRAERQKSELENS